MNKAVIVAYEMLTNCGGGVEANFSALLRGTAPFRTTQHFDSRGKLLGIIDDLDLLPVRGSTSRAEHLVNLLIQQFVLPEALPADTPIYIATTVGAIDRIERGETLDSCQVLGDYIAEKFNTQRIICISAACASGQVAIAAAAQSIERGESPYAIVVGCDICSEFVFSGFSSLGALSVSNHCRPYSSTRDGLLLGEGIGVMCLCAESFAKKRGYPIFAKIAGYSSTCDASHLTAPNQRGNHLARCIEQALENARWEKEDVGAVMGHGTGTRHNDAAELAAVQNIWGVTGVPLMSVKANFGHTLGATGILQAIIGTEILLRGIVPPQTGLQEVEPLGAQCVAASPRLLSQETAGLLSVNVGFGGINSVLALGLHTAEKKARGKSKKKVL